VSQWDKPESIEQRLLVKRLHADPRTKDLPWFSVPNGSNKSLNQARLFKAEGLRAGVPDLIFPVPNKLHAGLAIEMKRPDGKGVVSKHQREFMDRLRKHGWATVVCISAADAWEHIAAYLEFRP
jgi:hypothetical protein